MVSAAIIHFAIGLGLGVLTSLPIGVANVAVVDAGLRVGRRRALGIAAGAALADTAQSTAAFAGVGPQLDRHPLLPAILFAVSGVLIAGYGVHAIRAAALPHPGGGSGRGGFLLGLMLTGLNPAAMLAWIVVAGALAPTSAAVGAIAAAGVGLGAFAWFALLAHLASRGRDVLSTRGHALARWVGGVLIVLGVISLGRGAYLLAFR